MFVCARVHVLSVNFVCLVVRFSVSIFFLPTNTCIITWRLFVYAILVFFPLYALAGMQMFSIYACICVRSRAE